MRSVLLLLTAVVLAGCGNAVLIAHHTVATPTAVPFPIPYTATSGHFAARFPSTPTETTIPASIGSYTLEIHVVVARDGAGAVEVGEEDIQPAMPSDQYQSALVAALESFSTGSGIPIAHKPYSTTYRNTTAWEATYASKGLTMTGIVFMSGGARLYLLFAPSSELSSLTESFAIVG